MKGGLGKPTLPAVDGALAVEKPLTEKLFGDVTPAGFDKLPVMGHQDIPNMVGMGDQSGALRA